MKNYLQIEELSKQIEELYSTKELYLQIKKIYLQIEELYWICRLKILSADHKLSTNQGSIWSAGRRSTYGSKNYFQEKVCSVDWKSIWFADWRSICRLANCKSKKYLICRSKNYLQMKELKRRLRNYLQIEEPFVNWRNVCRPKNCSISRLKNDMQIKELSTGWQNYLQIE